MSGIGKPKDEEVSAESPQAFSRDVLRGVYSQLFKRPVPAEKTHSTEQDVGLQTREEICGIMRSARGSATNDTTARVKADAKLNDLYVASRSETTSNSTLSQNQWDGLKEAFSPRYALLQDIQIPNAMKPNEPNEYGVLKFGSYELALLYHWLFRHEDSHQAHNYLHALKRAALAEWPRAIEVVLGVLFNDEAFTGFVWPRVNKQGQTVPKLVTLDIDEAVVAQMVSLLANRKLSELEPYEEGGVCIIGAPFDKGNICY
ncbi:hypothetical protein D7Y21_11310 [Corallococcus sp. AB045]|uniref:hypothetical protein n=1 Tax=Corallococcus sp. AB045 TaxID=2316719 RepID=UPI000ECE7495|nr:hypothetical protein [Corallococcus sp. AB045]RKH89285.1 hypothetical protein D7Y21_11310 [Corallococcus sp. AB045]